MLNVLLSLGEGSLIQRVHKVRLKIDTHSLNTSLNTEIELSAPIPVREEGLRVCRRSLT